MNFMTCHQWYHDIQPNLDPIHWRMSTLPDREKFNCPFDWKLHFIHLQHIFNSVNADVMVPNMITSSNGSIFLVTGPLCGEGTGDRWIPLTVTWSFDVLFDLCQNKQSSKQPKHRWLEMLSSSSWHHCNETQKPFCISDRYKLIQALSILYICFKTRQNGRYWLPMNIHFQMFGLDIFSGTTIGYCERHKVVGKRPHSGSYWYP